MKPFVKVNWGLAGLGYEGLFELEEGGKSIRGQRSVSVPRVIPDEFIEIG